MVTSAGIAITDIDHVVLHGSSDVARSLARHLGIEARRFADPLTAACGDCDAPKRKYPAGSRRAMNLTLPSQNAQVPSNSTIPPVGDMR